MIDWLRSILPDTVYMQADGRGLLPLHVACRTGNANAVRILLQHCSAQVNQGEKPPIFFAIKGGHIEVAAVRGIT